MVAIMYKSVVSTVSLGLPKSRLAGGFRGWGPESLPEAMQIQGLAAA